MAAGRLLRTIIESWLALPSRLSVDALDLLVVLELELEQLDHLHGRAGRAGDGDAAVAVGREHLLHRAVADEVAASWPAGRRPSRRRRRSGRPRTVVPWVMARRSSTFACGDRRARGRCGAAARRSSDPGSSAGREQGHGHRARRLPAAPRLHVTASRGRARHRRRGDRATGRPSGRRTSRTPRRSLEHLVDLVEEVVELRLDLLAASRTSQGPLRPPRPASAGAGFFFCSRSAIAISSLQLSTTRAARATRRQLAHSSIKLPTCACGSAQRFHHRHPAQRVAADVEHQRIPVGGHDVVGPLLQALAPEVGPGVGRAARSMARSTSSSSVIRSQPDPGEQRLARGAGRGTAGPSPRSRASSQARPWRSR